VLSKLRRLDPLIADFTEAPDSFLRLDDEPGLVAADLGEAPRDAPLDFLDEGPLSSGKLNSRGSNPEEARRWEIWALL
jgi:hypothetical protein